MAEHVGDTRFQDRDVDEVEDVIAWVHGRDLADATVNTYKKALRASLPVDHNLLAVVRVLDVPIVRLISSPIRTPVSSSIEIRALSDGFFAASICAYMSSRVSKSFGSISFGAPEPIFIQSTSRGVSAPSIHVQNCLCEWFGWMQGSDVPARYVHLRGRDIDDAYDQIHELYEPEEEEQKPDVVECPRYEELNEPDTAFCMRCGQALDIDAAKEVETAEDATTENADDENLQLALQVVEAMRSDSDRVLRSEF